jgi:glycosyltransferase involved in cell wall biosynthesis
VATLPVSVVIPAYEAESYIMRALDGVARQTAQPSEVIVVDDGSRDGTAEVARRAGARVIQQPNRGASSARNTGIQAARFPWIALLDADDRWFPEKLAVQWTVHEKQPDVRMLLTDYSVLNAAGTDIGSAFARQPHYAVAPRRRIGENVSFFERHEFAQLLARGNIVSPSTLLLDRQWLFEHELMYATSLPESDDFFVAEDYEWVFRALRFSDVLVVERCLADYWQRPVSRSSQRGRQASGDIALGECIGKRPGLYVAGAAAMFERNRPLHERRAALEYLRQDEFRAAAKSLRRAVVERPSVQTAALFALANAGRWQLAAAAIQRARKYRLNRKRSLSVQPAERMANERSSVGRAPISVVIPAHNVEAYLDAALQSVRAQTLQPAEIVIVDDGSVDATRQIAERAGVRVISQPQAGVSAARNVGIAAATSPWIALLDADDCWRPDKLERQWAAHLLAPESRILASDYALIFERGGSIESAHAGHPSYSLNGKTQLAPAIVRLDRGSLARTLPRGHSLTPSTWLVERSLFLAEPFDTNLPMTPLYQIGEDFEWLLRALRHSDVVVVEEPLTRYLQRSSGNLSAVEGRQRFGDVKLGSLVNSTPERYVSGAAAAFLGLRSEHERIAIVAYLRSGDARSAAAVLGSIPVRRRGAAWLALRALAYGIGNPLGSSAWRGIRTLRRSLART